MVIRELKPRLIELSQRKRCQATSHRNFDVGVAAVAWGPHLDPFVVSGANCKTHNGPRRHGNGDHCGEMEAIETAKTLGCPEITYMVITAPPEADDMSGLDFGVTVSCYFCRIAFREEIGRPNSPLKGRTRLFFNHPMDQKKSFELTVEEFLTLFPNDPKYIPTAAG